MADQKLSIRITADGSDFVNEAGKVRRGIEDIGDGAKKASSSLSTFGSLLGALQLDRIISDVISATTEMIRFAASLDDLADVTGSSVEDLSALANMAKFSGVSFNTLEQALTQMSRRLSATDDEAKRAGAAMRMLGVEARDPAQALNEIAQKFAQYADGANKVALAQELFGRSGAQMLPLLKDLAEQGEVGARITGEQAAQAERLGKEIAQLSLNFQTLAMVMANEVVPAMNAFLSMTRESGFAGFFAWAGLTPKDQEDVGAAIGETVKKIDSLRETIKTLSADTLTAKLNRLLSPEDLAVANKQLEVLEARLKELQRMAASSPAPAFRPDAPTVPGRTGTSRGRAAIDEETKALREREKVYMALYKTALEYAEAEVKLEEAIRKVGTAAADAIANDQRRLEQQAQAIDAFERETDAIGKTADEVAELAIQRLEERKAQLLGMEGAEKHIELLDREIAAIRRRRQVESVEEARGEAQKASQAALQEWERTADSISSSLTDALLRGFESGKDFVSNFVATLKNMFSTLVLRPIIQGIVAPVSGGLAGLLPGSAGANSLGGAGGLLGGGGGLFNLFGEGAFGAGSLFGSGGVMGSLGGGGGIFGAGGALAGFATSGIGQGLGLSVAMGAGEGIALTALGATLGAALPIIGIGLAIAGAMGLFDRKGGPKTGGSASNIPGMERFFTPNSGDAAAAKIVASQQSAYASALKGLGGSGSAQFAVGFDEDPEGTAGSRVSAGAMVNGRMVYDVRDRDVGRGEGAVDAALELESKRVLLAALQASDLPEQIARVMDSIGATSATAEQIDTLLQFGTAMNAVVEAINGDVAADAAKAWERSQLSVTEGLREMGNELIKLAHAQDGSVAKMQELAAGATAYRAAVQQALIGIKELGKAIKDMFADARTTIETAGLSDQAAYNYWRNKGNTAALELETTTDPNRVSTIANDVAKWLTTAFNLLDPAAQAAMRPQFLQELADLDADVADALTRIGTGIEAGTKDPFAAVNEALGTASVDFGAAATGMGAAADTMAAAANTMSTAASTIAAAAADMEDTTVTVQVAYPQGSAVGA